MAVPMVSYPSSVLGTFVMQSMPSCPIGILGTGMDFSFSPPFSNLPPHLAGNTAFDVIYNLLSEAWEVYFGLDKGNSFVSAKVTTHSLGFN